LHSRIPRKVRLLAGSLAVFLFASALSITGRVTKAEEPNPLERISQEIIPAAGTQTDYGIPLSLESLPLLIGWKDTLVLTATEQAVFHDALVQLVAPCCDDNTAFQCCCEKGGSRCNIVTSGKGLAAHLIREKGYTVDQVSDAVLQWFRFARPDYYVAVALEKEGIEPGLYGLTTQGDCYRGMCEVPISQGGCGGMGELVEPTIQGGQG